MPRSSLKPRACETLAQDDPERHSPPAHTIRDSTREGPCLGKARARIAKKKAGCGAQTHLIC